MTAINAIKTDGRGPFLEVDPRERLPVSADWSAWLTQEATTIASSAWTVDGVLVLSAATFTTAVASVIVSGALAGGTCTLRNTITCANGLISSRSLRVIGRDR